MDLEVGCGKVVKRHEAIAKNEERMHACPCCQHDIPSQAHPQQPMRVPPIQPLIFPPDFD
jgi:hypothetical protein